MISSKVHDFSEERRRMKSIGHARSMLRLIDRALDEFAGITAGNGGEGHLAIIQGNTAGARDALLAFLKVVVLIVFFALPFSAHAQHYGPGAFPSYEYPPTMPGVPGPTVYLMPDGGTWWVGPNAMPGFAPPPVYIPPAYPREIIIHDNNRRPARRK